MAGRYFFTLADDGAWIATGHGSYFKINPPLPVTNAAQDKSM